MSNLEEVIAAATEEDIMWCGYVPIENLIASEEARQAEAKRYKWKVNGLDAAHNSQLKSLTSLRKGIARQYEELLELRGQVASLEAQLLRRTVGSIQLCNNAKALELQLGNGLQEKPRKH